MCTLQVTFLTDFFRMLYRGDYTLIYMILVMLLLVLTIVRGTGGDLYVILLFEGRGGGGGGGGRFFVPPLNKRMTQKSLPVPGDTFALRGNGDF